MREAQVTKDIVRDLLRVYLAGDASADTRTVVETFLAKGAELREIVEAAGHYSLPALEAPASLEMRSLNRTRRLLGRKNFWLGFALVFSSVPPFLQPWSWWLADLVMLIGLIGWVPFLITCRDLSATGLEARRSTPLWSGTGLWIGGVLVQLIQQQTGWHRGTFFLAAMTSVLASWIGVKLRYIQTGEELSRPTTLFGK